MSRFKISAAKGDEQLVTRYASYRDKADRIFEAFVSTPGVTQVDISTDEDGSWKWIRSAHPRTVAPPATIEGAFAHLDQPGDVIATSPLLLSVVRVSHVHVTARASREATYTVTITETQRQLIADALDIMSPDNTAAQVALAMLIDAVARLPACVEHNGAAQPLVYDLTPP